jgi:hypothetical protein
MPTINEQPEPLSVPSGEDLAHLDELLDEALEETFPASDPIALGTERRPTKPVADEPSSRDPHRGT